MEPRLVFLILIGIAIGLSCLTGYWRKKAGEAAFAAALLADKNEDRDLHCRLAVMAGHKDACRMFSFAHSDYFEDRHPLKPFCMKGISVAFYGHYYPSRYKRLLSEEQRRFCRSLYAFKEGENHGIDFFKACMAVLPVDTSSYHIMFMPCSNWIKYEKRFKRLNWYITTHRQELTSGLYDIVVYDTRESLHESKGNGRKLEKNYSIIRNIRGKRIIIVDDVLTSGQSLINYKEELERCGGKVTAAIFYGKTVTLPPMFLIRVHVWCAHLINKLRKKTAS